MMINKSTHGLSIDQLENGTPNDKRLELRAYYKDKVMTISPAKDINGRYLGIDVSIPESKRLEMGYVPHIETTVKITDGLVIDLNEEVWRKDWEWLKYCGEIAPDFETGQGIKGAFFYVYRAGEASAKKVSKERARVYLMNLVLTDSPENLYNRVKVLGVNMDSEAITDVQEYLLEMIKTDMPKVKNVYESKMFALDLLYLNALDKNVIVKQGGVVTFGDVLLGVDRGTVISFFQNPNNAGTVSNIESMVYGTSKLAGEQVNTQGVDELDLIENAAAEEERKKIIRERSAKGLAKAREIKAQKAAEAKAAKEAEEKAKK